MKARAIGRFLAEFLDGFTSTEDTENATAAPVPIVVPVEAIRPAVAECLRQIMEEMEGADPVPSEPSSPSASAEQLNMIFAEAGREGPADDIAEATLRRVHDIQEKEARREAAVRNGQAVPEYYDPNDPASAKPWQAPIARE